MIDIDDMRAAWGIGNGEVTPEHRGIREDLARALNETERLRELVKASFFEGYLDACGERGNITGNWERSDAKAALDRENT